MSPARAGIADIVIPLGFRFVWGALPTDAELEAMSGAGFAGPISLEPAASEISFERDGADSISANVARTIELWFDPAPNAQLMLVQLLDCLGSRESIVAEADFVSGGRRALAIKLRKRFRMEAARSSKSGTIISRPPAWPGRRIDSRRRSTGSICSTGTSGALPQLRQTVLELLEELPMPATGLGATEMRMLELVAAGNASPFDVFPGHRKRNTRRVFDYWEVGSLLDGLGSLPGASRGWSRRGAVHARKCTRTKAVTRDTSRASYR